MLIRSNIPRTQNKGTLEFHFSFHLKQGAQWLSDRVLDSRPRDPLFKPHRHHCVVSLSKNINPSLVLVQPRKTHPFITERLLMGCKESNLTHKTKFHLKHIQDMESKSIWHVTSSCNNTCMTPVRHIGHDTAYSIAAFGIFYYSS